MGVRRGSLAFKEVRGGFKGVPRGLRKFMGVRRGSWGFRKVWKDLEG